MLWLFLIGLAVFIVVCIIVVLFLRIYIKVHYSWKDKEQEVQVSIFLVNIKLLQKQIPIHQIEDANFMEELDKKLEFRLDSMLKTTQKLLEALQTILNDTKLHQLEWSTFLGTGEASSTGMASGIVWSVKGTIVGYFVEKLILMCQPTIHVNPKFQEACFQTNLDCMVSIRIGKAILGFVKLTRIIKAK